MKWRGRSVVLAAAVVAMLCVLVAYQLRPRHGVCVSRNMMFWRTKVKATKLRNNIYMLNTYGTDLVSANTTALIGDDGVLMIDAGHPEMVDKERDALPRLGDPRVRIVINSHEHADHACANEKLFGEGAMILGPRSERQRFPQIIYERELNIRFNDEHVRLIAVPPAHTDDDTITVFPRSNVIAAGDLFINGTFPYLGGSDIDGYIAAEELILRLSNDQTLIVPGHGPVGRRPDLQKSLDRLREVRRRIANLIDQGLTKEQVVALNPLDDLQPGPSRELVEARAVAGFVYESMKRRAAKPTDDRSLRRANPN